MLEVKDLRVHFRSAPEGKDAVKGISFSVADRAIIAWWASPVPANRSLPCPSAACSQREKRTAPAASCWTAWIS